MAIKRVHEKRPRNPEELARIRALRERFQKKRPTMEQLVASGEFNEPVPQGVYLALRQLMIGLREERKRQGLSLSQVARASGIDKAALSRLETGRLINPTLNTLWRYAMVLNKEIVLGVDGRKRNGEVKVNGRSLVKRKPRGANSKLRS